MNKKEAAAKLCITYALLYNIYEQTGKYLWYANKIRDIVNKEIEDSVVINLTNKLHKAFEKDSITTFEKEPTDAILTIVIDNLIDLESSWSQLNDKYKVYAKILGGIKNSLLNHWKYKFNGNEEQGFILIDKIIKEIC